MAKFASGKRYAQAAFEMALEKGDLDSWQTSLEKIADLAIDAGLVDLLESPKLPFVAKKSLLEERLGEINPLALNLACLLTSKDKLRVAGDVLQEYNRLLDAHNGIEHAKVTTALPLDDEEEKELSGRFEEMFEHKIVIEAQTDPSLIGGFRAKIGDTLIDGSIRTRLESLRKSLIEGER